MRRFVEASRIWASFRLLISVFLLPISSANEILEMALMAFWKVCSFSILTPKPDILWLFFILFYEAAPMSGKSSHEGDENPGSSFIPVLFMQFIPTSWTYNCSLIFLSADGRRNDSF